jgi:polar amino acid transport system substrate-binding protein
VTPPQPAVTPSRSVVITGVVPAERGSQRHKPRDQHRGRRVAVVASALVVAASLVVGCGPGAVQPPDQRVSYRAPEPVGASVVVVPPSAVPSTSAAPDAAPAPGTTPAVPDCDATASLRPVGPLPPPGQPPAGSTMETIVKAGRLRVGVDQNTYLFGFRNSATGELEGFDIDVARQIAEALFGDPDRIQFVTLTSAQRIPALQADLVDIVVRTMTITCARRVQVDFSTVYYLAGQRVLVRRGSGITGLDALTGRRVCAAAGSTSIIFLADSAARPVPVTVPNWTDCLVMLQQGQVDAVSTDDAILAGLAAQDPYTEVVGPRLTEEPYGVAIAKGREDLVRFVNAVLERMRADGTWTAIHRRWLGALGPAPAPPPARYQP